MINESNLTETEKYLLRKINDLEQINEELVEELTKAKKRISILEKEKLLESK